MARICGKIYVFCKIYTPRIYFAGPAAINTCVHYIGLILISKKYRWNWLSSIYMYYTDREFRRRRSSTVDIVFFYETFFGIEFSEHIISRILLFWIFEIFQKFRPILYSKCQKSFRIGPNPWEKKKWSKNSGQYHGSIWVIQLSSLPSYSIINMTHNALSLMRIGKSFIHFRSTHWRHQSTFFIEIYQHNFKKPMGHLSLC